MATPASLCVGHISWLLWALVVSLLLGIITGEEDPQLSLNVHKTDASITARKEFTSRNEKKLAVGGTADAGEIWIAHLGIFLDHDSGRGHESVLVHGTNAKEIDDVLEAELSLLERSEKMEFKGKETKKFQDVNHSRSDETEEEIGDKIADTHNSEHGQMDEKRTNGLVVQPSEIRKPRSMSLLSSFSSHRHILENAGTTESSINKSPKEVKDKVRRLDLPAPPEKKDDVTVSKNLKSGGTSSSSDVGKSGQNLTENNSDKVNDGKIQNSGNQTSTAKPEEASHVKTTEDQISKGNPDESSRDAKSAGEQSLEGQGGKNATHGGKSNPESGDQDVIQQTDCGGFGCGDARKMLACLRTSGDGTHELSLLVQNKGDNTLNVKVTTPDFLSAGPSASLAVEKGKSATVHIVVVDFKAAKLADRSMLNITTGDYACSIQVPTQYLGNLSQRRFFQGFSYPYMTKPMAIVYMLLFVLVGTAIGGWLCCRYSRKRRRGDGIKYQELEIGDLHQERVNKSEEETLDGWDEVWDDGWQDTEAARLTSRPILNLSSKGLASRKSNKEGWETSWDD